MSIDNLTDEEIAQHFSAMDDSVSLINAIVADDTEALEQNQNREDPAAEVKGTVSRNVEHLETQAETDWYKDSSNSKTAYTNAVTAGKSYVSG
jgi:hypothetical protein